MNIRQSFRRFFPRVEDPVLDAPILEAAKDRACGAIYLSELDTSDDEQARHDDFLRSRFLEGCRWRNVIEKLAGQRLPETRVLDLGAGNGAVELAFAAADYRIVSVDALWNECVRRLHAASPAPLRRVIAEAGRLPFRRESFDVVVCLETIEHLESPAESGAEMSRVLRRKGIVLLTTPPRWRFALGPDPHFGIHWLLLLPAFAQRWVAARRGFDQAHHHVDRIYGSVGQIARLFKDCDLASVLSRSRMPRRFFWDAIVFRKR